MTIRLEFSAPHVVAPESHAGPFADWGVIPTMIEGEFCHFLLGRCTYTHESGEVIEVVPGTVAFFPRDWRGTCRAHETVRKVYMIR